MKRNRADLLFVFSIALGAPAIGAERPPTQHNVCARSSREETGTRKGANRMTEAEVKKFVDAFAQAWAHWDGAAFLRLWHPDGLLRTPFANRVIKGSELGKFVDLQKQRAPNLTWKLLGWASRGNVVVIEWENSNRYGEQLMTWRGVDRITVECGKIREEVVYADTAPLQARRRGTTFEALLQLPD